LTSPYADCNPFSVPSDHFSQETALVDWICVRIFTGSPSSLTEVASQSTFVREDGTIGFTDSASLIDFRDIPRDDYYLSIEHRNHLSVMSAVKLDFRYGSANIDFRSDPNTAYSNGGAPMKDLGDGNWGMWGGDGNSDDTITAFDFIDHWLPENGAPPGYYGGDFNMNGSLTAFDFIDHWLPANGKSSQVPDF